MGRVALSDERIPPTVARRRTLRLAGLVAAVLLSTAPAGRIRAQDDGHGHGAPASVPIQLAPRGQARSDGIEAVVVAAPGRRLVVYLDRVGTSAPLEGATVEADADGVLLTLRDTGDGVYLGDDWFPGPGTNQVVVNWRLGDGTGKIEVAIDIPQTGIRPRSRAASIDARFDQTGLGVAAALALVVYLLATLLFVWRSRRQRAAAGR